MKQSFGVFNAFSPRTCRRWVRWFDHRSDAYSNLILNVRLAASLQHGA